MTLELEMRIAELERENKTLRNRGKIKAINKAYVSWLRSARALQELQLSGRPNDLLEFLDHFDCIGDAVRGDDK